MLRHRVIFFLQHRIFSSCIENYIEIVLIALSIKCVKFKNKDEKKNYPKALAGSSS